ncbi:hypothetical protein Scep_015405 [Stephania cephalantha]|uniref:Uncharacterized protein n=1 Tax=Stephania cephalantha TaxID=152367 RepID=A0AAP0J352_9MAGN
MLQLPESSPLHLAARGGSLDCVRELLAGGADRPQRDFREVRDNTIGMKNNQTKQNE